MLNSIVLSDEIALWWEKEWETVENTEYFVSCNGEKKACGAKTHCVFKRLNENTTYQFQLFKSTVKDESVLIEETSITTLSKRFDIDITKAPYYAKGDGKTINTKAIQRAIDDCDENSRVYFPKGIFLSGALKLHSGVELFLEEKAVLQGSANAKDYLPKIKSRYEGIERECYQSLLTIGDLNHKDGYTTKNIIVRGQGAILGGGASLMKNIFQNEGEIFDVATAWSQNPKALSARRSRGRLLQVANTENLILSGLTVGMGPAWNLHFIYSRNIVTYGCKIVSQHVNNGDGWDPDSSENCVLFDVFFDTGDDCVAIKSGKNPEGNEIDRPSKGIKIFDCRANSGHGISIGSEMSGGVEDVKIWNCELSKTNNGVQIKGTKKRGGYVRNVMVKDCQLSRLTVHCVGYNDDDVGAKTPPVFENFHFENLDMSCCFPIPEGIELGPQHLAIYESFGENRTVVYPGLKIVGFGEEHPIRNVALKNLSLQRQDEKTPAFDIRYVENLKMENVRVK